MRLLYLLTFISLSLISTSQTSYSLLKKISNSSPGGDNFGWRVDIDGDYAVASKYHENAIDRGVVYVYHKHEGGYNNWGIVDTLNPLTLIDNSWFGTSLAISGTTILVTAQYNSLHGGGTNVRGVGYIFEQSITNCNEWIESRQITSNTTGNEGFGIFSADIDGDIIAASNISFTLTSGKGVQIFSRNQGGSNNWGRVRTVVSSDFSSADGFGWDLKISGDNLVVGAFLNDDAGTSSGSAYIFNRNQGGTNNWGQVRKIVASDAVANDQFGSSVAINNDNVIVGSQSDDNANGNAAGGAYIFNRNQGGTNNWGQVRKLTGSSTIANNLFGIDVSIYNDKAIVSAAPSTSNSVRERCYVFNQNTGGINNWGETQVLIGTVPANQSAWYGHDIVITDETILIGDPNESGDQGAIYFYLDTNVFADTPVICNNETAINLNTTFSPFSSNVWIGPGVFNDSLLNATGLTGIIEYKALIGNGICDTVSQFIEFDTARDAGFTSLNFCNGGSNSITITGDNGGTFSFNPLPLDPAIINSTTGIISNYMVDSSYTIQYVVGGTCPDTVTQTVTVLNQLTNNLSDTICTGDSIEIGTSTYFNTGNYSDTLLSTAGCDSIINLDLLVNDNSLTRLTDSLCATNNETVTFNGQNISTPGTYYDTLTAANTCDSIIELVVVNYCEVELIIPNFISPNGDGFNDIWFITGLQNFPENKVKVFNRYGSLVYSQDNYANDWSGIPNEGSIINKSSDEILPAGTYFFILELSDKNYTGIIQIRL